MVNHAHYRSYSVLGYALKMLGEMKDKPDPDPDVDWGEDAVQKAIPMTTAAGLIHSLHDDVENKELQDFLHETKLLKRIDRRILHITESDIPYPKSEELIKAGKMILAKSRGVVTRERVKTYRNPDERCGYPFTPDGAGYCWSFAHFIDKGDEWLKDRKVEKMEDICEHCECWTEAPNFDYSYAPCADREKVWKFVPIDKSWTIRMGVLDLINRPQVNDGGRIVDILSAKQDFLGDDLLALKRIIENWDSSNDLDVGESGTLYRFIRFALWKFNKPNKIIKRGTLLNRDMCDNPEIIDLTARELLELDNNTSQWASASALLGSEERIQDAPNKLKLTYEAVELWNEMWDLRYDRTIEKQAKAFVSLIETGKMDFVPEHSEDYCFSRAFDLITPELGEERFPSITGHETNRIKEMEKAIQQADSDLPIDSKDHRVVQAVAMRQMAKGREITVTNKQSVNKSWPQFWDFISSLSGEEEEESLI